MAEEDPNDGGLYHVHGLKDLIPSWIVVLSVADLCISCSSNQNSRFLYGNFKLMLRFT